MNTTKSQQVFDIISQTIEQHAFLLCDLPELAESDACPESGIRVDISADGDTSASMTLLLPESVCRALVGNLLDEEIAIDQRCEDSVIARDAMGELANVLAGTLFYELSEDKKPLLISTPAISSYNESYWDQLSSQSSSMRLLIDDVAMLFSISINNESIIDEALR